MEITTLSNNAFYYFGRDELKHKLLLIEDLDGADNVLYPLRELQSKRRISKTVTLKDNKGNLKTITLNVEGPVCVSGCTTKSSCMKTMPTGASCSTWTIVLSKISGSWTIKGSLVLG